MSLLSKLTEKYSKKKLISIIVGGIIVILGSFFGLSQETTQEIKEGANAVIEEVIER